MTTTGKVNEFQTTEIFHSFLKETIKETVSQILSEFLPGLLTASNPKEDEKPKKWLTRQAAAKKFGVSLPTIDLHSKNGNLKAHYFGRLIRFDENELDAAPIPFTSLLRSKSLKKK